MSRKIYFVGCALLLAVLASCQPGQPTVEKVTVYETRYKEVEKQKYVDATAIPTDFGSPMDSYVVSSKFGFRKNPIEGEPDRDFNMHKGLDLVGPKDASIYAVKAGTVVAHFPPPNGHYRGHPVYGGMVIIDHGKGIYTLYAHMKKTFVWEGQFVEQGDIIGIQGHSGEATGDHLHFEIIIDPTYALKRQDPEPTD